MRSFVCRATNMRPMFCFFLLFSYLPMIENIKGEDGCLSQPNQGLWSKSGQSAVIECTVDPHCSNAGLVYKWFVLKENCHSEVNNDQSKYSLDGASLTINSLNKTDSGVYYCAAISSNEEPAPDTQYIALGTTLSVRETFKIMVRHILLWLLCILLAIYSVAIVSLIIIKKVCRKTDSTEKKTSIKRIQFRDVLQELYKKRSLETNQQNSRTKRSHVETASAETLNSHDDIYQNV